MLSKLFLFSATRLWLFAAQTCNVPTAHVTVCYAYDNKKRIVSICKMMESDSLVATSRKLFLASAYRRGQRLYFIVEERLSFDTHTLRCLSVQHS